MSPNNQESLRAEEAWFSELFYMLNKHVKYVLKPEQMLDLERRQDTAKIAIRQRIALAQQEARIDELKALASKAGWYSQQFSNEARDAHIEDTLIPLSCVNERLSELNTKGSKQL